MRRAARQRLRAPARRYARDRRGGDRPHKGVPDHARPCPVNVLLAKERGGARATGTKSETTARVGHVPSSMKKRACVKVTDFGRLDAWPVAAARAVAEAFQSSIRPRGAGQSAKRGSGAQ